MTFDADIQRRFDTKRTEPIAAGCPELETHLVGPLIRDPLAAAA